MTEIKCIKWKNLEGIQMENNTVSVVILPRLGGKLASLQYKKTKFEFAAQMKEQQYQIPGRDAEFEKFDASGLDDVFPSIAGSRVMSRNGEKVYPDHGEIWSSPFEYEIGRECVHLSFRSTRFSYTYEKTLELKENQVIIYYHICNEQKEPFPCLWAFHGLMRYEEDMELWYPKEVDSFENVLFSQELGAAERHVPIWNKEYDFSKVPARESGTMVKYYADKKIKSGFCGYRYPSYGMECVIEYNAQKLPYLGTWITAGGYRGDYNCAMEPANGYYDDIYIAEKNNSLYLLEKENPLDFHIKITMREMNKVSR